LASMHQELSKYAPKFSRYGTKISRYAPKFSKCLKIFIVSSLYHDLKEQDIKRPRINESSLARVYSEYSLEKKAGKSGI
jgi:hypothetical protein